MCLPAIKNEINSLKRGLSLIHIYGPYDPDTHEPSGYYDLYVAEFECHGIRYQVVTEQLKEQEIVKVVSSMIYGEDVTVDE